MFPLEWIKFIAFCDLLNKILSNWILREVVSLNSPKSFLLLIGKGILSDVRISVVGLLTVISILILGQYPHWFLTFNSKWKDRNFVLKFQNLNWNMSSSWMFIWVSVIYEIGQESWTKKKANSLISFVSVSSYAVRIFAKALCFFLKNKLSH